MSIKIQIVDGKEVDHSGLVKLCGEAGYQVALLLSGKKALQQVKREKPDVVFLSFDLPDLSGVELLKKIKKSCEDTIIFSLVSSVEQGVGAMRLGAEHYLVKPYNLEEIKIVLEKCLAIKNFGETIERSRLHHLEDLEKSELIAVSKSMRESYHHALRFAEEGNAPLLIVGEVGTEKELLAKIIHVRSHQFIFPFVAVNCGENGSHSLSNHLFKIQRGAEGCREKEGEFQSLEGGTLFLYNVECLSKSDQLRLLKFLKSKRGGKKENRKSAVKGKRIIAATNVNLKTLVDKGKFNKELYQRITRRFLHIPPLRKRTNEILPLAMHLMKTISKEYGKCVEKIEQDVCTYLESYEWPGNLGELRNFIERAVILTSSESISMKEIEFNVNKKLMTLESLLMSGSFLSLDEMVSLYVNTVLKKVKGNKSRAAKILKVSRNTLKKKSIAV